MDVFKKIRKIIKIYTKKKKIILIKNFEIIAVGRGRQKGIKTE